MARQPRLDLPGIPQHVVQRGNNRLPCFLEDADRRRYLTLLKETLLETECRLHAYVLMDNHVHLLVTPPESGAIARLMQKLGRGYVGQFNIRHRRTGTLWEGRYKACLVDNESYVLRCHRYIDLNPSIGRINALFDVDQRLIRGPKQALRSATTAKSTRNPTICPSIRMIPALGCRFLALNPSRS